SCATGEACYNRLAPDLRHWIDLGAPVPIQIRMDEPYGANIDLHLDDNYVVNQAAIFITLLRSNFMVEIADIEPYPIYSAAKLLWWVQALSAACAAAGVQPPDSFELDHDWRQAGFTVLELRAIRDQVRALNEKFGYILGSPVVPDNTWHDQAVNM